MMLNIGNFVDRKTLNCLNTDHDLKWVFLVISWDVATYIAHES